MPAYIKRGGGIYCSVKCRHVGIITRVKIICKACGKEFEVSKSRRLKAKYCSRKCRITRVHKKCAVCDKEFSILKSWVLPVNLCDKKCRAIYVGKQHRGPKHWNWKGGFTQDRLQRERRRMKKYHIKNRQKILVQVAETATNRLFGVYRSELAEWQNNRCAICGQQENGKRLSVDHNHDTGQVRMLLCNGCNTGNKITDNIELLKAKIEYLEAFSP